MKFIYACDIHGDEEKYNTLLERLIKEEIRCLVLGGDLLPKFCNNRYKEQKEFINGFLNKYFIQLKENNIDCFCILGNDDLEELDEEFENMCNKHKNVFNIDNKKEDIEDISFIGLSKVLDHPFGCKDRVVIENNLEMQHQLSPRIYVEKCKKMLTIDEWKEYREKHIDRMEDILKNLPKAEKNKKVIYVFHNPPFGIGLDVCMNKRQVGSKAITKFLEESNAYMSLHGHIHESPRVTGIKMNELNKTLCIQPGQTERKSGIMYYMKIDTDLEIIDYVWGKAVDRKEG